MASQLSKTNLTSISSSPLETEDACYAANGELAAEKKGEGEERKESDSEDFKGTECLSEVRRALESESYSAQL